MPTVLETRFMNTVSNYLPRLVYELTRLCDLMEEAKENSSGFSEDENKNEDEHE